MTDGSRRRTLVFACLLLVPTLAGAAPQEEPPTSAPPPPSGPTVAAAPDAAAPTMPLPVTGSGFDRSCGAEIVLEPAAPPRDYPGALPAGRSAVTAPIDEQGGFTVPWSAAAGTPPGPYRLVARGLEPAYEGEDAPCTSPSDEVAEVPFTVLPSPPSIWLANPEVRPGTSFELAGSGFCRAAGCSPVTILVDGMVAVSRVEVSAGGALSVAVPIPAVTADGTVFLEALQSDADGRELRAQGEIVVTVRPPTRPEPIQ